MAKEKKDYVTDYRTITIRTSDGATVQGRVNIAPAQRVSELFTAHKGPFVVVVQASYGELMNKTLFINKNNIVWVEPDDTEITEDF